MGLKREERCFIRSLYLGILSSKSIRSLQRNRFVCIG